MPAPMHGLANCNLKNKAKLSNTQHSHIAKNSKLFEQTKHGGNYQEYLKLTLTIARSGVPDAEDIFVEAASIAKEADPEEKLREVLQDLRTRRAAHQWSNGRYFAALGATAWGEF